MSAYRVGTWLELGAIDVTRRPQGKVLINVADIESVRPAAGIGRNYNTEIGSIVRTRSGDERLVEERVETVKAALQKILEMEGDL